MAYAIFNTGNIIGLSHLIVFVLSMITDETDSNADETA